MSNADQEVARVSDLLRMSFGPDEHAVLSAQMSRILQYFESPDDVETEGSEPIHALHPAAAPCCDEDRSCISLNAVCADASDSEKTFSQLQKS